MNGTSGTYCKTKYKQLIWRIKDKCDEAYIHLKNKRISRISVKSPVEIRFARQVYDSDCLI